MIVINIGDCVLMEHECMYDRFKVRRITKVNKAMIETERLDADSDGYTHPARRKKEAVIGVFSTEAHARDAAMRLEPLYRQLEQATRALKHEFNSDIRALIK